MTVHKCKFELAIRPMLETILVVSTDSERLTNLIELLAAPEGSVVGISIREDIISTVQSYNPVLLILDETVNSFQILHTLSEQHLSAFLSVLIISDSHNSQLMNFNEWSSLSVDQIPLHGPTIHKRIALYLAQNRLNNNAEFLALLAVSADRTLCIDTNMKITISNQYGFSKSERQKLLGKSIADYLPDTARVQLLENIKIVEETHHRVQFEVSFENLIFNVILAPAIKNKKIQSYAISAHDVTQIRKQEEKIKQLEKYDPITELPTRCTFNDFMEKAISRARRNSRTMALCFINLDNFKTINTTFGHSYGDMLLKSVAQRLLNTMRASDFIARTSSDEFAVVLDEISRPEDAANVAQKIIRLISEPHQLGKYIGSTTASVGISFFSGDETHDDLYNTANIALSNAKQNGRNNYQFFSEEMQKKAIYRVRLEQDLSQAIQRKELELFYQPLINAKTKEVAALEALLRWRHHELGMISPGEFIPIAEETRQINIIGDWVLQNAIATRHQWEKENDICAELTVAINISVQQLNEKEFPDKVESLIKVYGVNPSHIECEITETALMSNPEAIIKTIEHVKSLGIQIAVDDYGTGYSSLNYIKQLPIDILKIDITFIRDIGINSKTEAIIISTISLAHDLEIKVVAEGVETEEQVNFLCEAECDFLQGYYYTRPLPKNELKKFIQEFTS